MKQMQLRFFLIVLAGAFLMTLSQEAFGEMATPPPATQVTRKPPTKKRVAKRLAPSRRIAPSAVSAYAPVASGVPGLPDGSLAARGPAPALSAAPLAATATVDEAPKRILNLRIHPIYLAEMLVQKNTLVSVRGDLDFVLGDRFTLGPSVIYQQTSNIDDVALSTSGTSQMANESFLEVGLLSNIYLTGTTSTGGFLLRPHVYWIDAQGEKDGASGSQNQASTSSTAGIRGGAEFVYQKILSNGFNFEVGGGFTYHFVPYEIDYPSGGTGPTTPSSRVAPTVSLAIGWAF